jgi:putative membrane protein
MRSQLMTLGLALLLAIGGACGDDDDDTNGGLDGGGGAAARGGSGGSAGRAGAGAGRGGSAGQNGGRGGSAADAGAELSDAQIAAVVLAANGGEVEQGEIAVNAGQRDDVRAFARMLVTMHSAAVERENALFRTLMLTPEENAVSAELKAASDATVQALNAANAAGFDMLYVMSQVDAHRKVLDLIDDRLLPSVTSAELRAELNTMRADVQRHLELATELLAALGEAPDGGTEDGGS